MPASLQPTAQSLWLGIGKQILSAIIGAGAVVFFLGGREAKINDFVTWKNDTAPRIERMDAKGTLSFEYFQAEYERTQARQETKIKELEKELRELERQVERKP